MAHRISNRGRSSRVTRPFRKNGRLGRWRALAFEPLESRVLLDAAGPLSGTVFEDLNHDGVMDIGEPGLPGFEVELERLGGHVRSSSFETYHGDVTSVAIQGDRYLVGVPGYRSKDSAVQLFDLHTGELLQTFRDPRPEIDAHFGLAVTFVGDNVLVSAPTTLVSDQPFAYLFDGVTGELLHTFVDPRADSRLSLASVGNHVLIGDAMDGSAYLFDATTGELVRTFSHPDNSVGEFGQSVAFVGDDVLVGARDRLYLFDGTTGEPLRVFANPAPSYNGFAHSLVVSGTQILVGTQAPWRNAEAERAAYLFDAGTGELLQTFTNPNDRPDVPFGESVAFLGDKVLVGASGNWSAGYAGYAYLFDAATGELLNTFRSPSRDGIEQYGFGRSIAA
ncbi:MAG: PQQ-binding-like beta-propeller repeat protein, partial [Planctomycetota bacterium]